MTINRRKFMRTAGAGLVMAGAAPGLRHLARPAAAQAIKVRGVFSAPVLAYAAMYVADELKLWRDNGLDVSLQAVRGGALATVALVNKEAEFMCVASSDPIVAWEKNISTVTVGCFTSALALSLSARNDWMAARRVTPDSPIADRVKALKGARVGAATVAGGPAQYLKYLVKTHGMDPERDIQLLAVGQGPSRIAALRENQVDLTIGAAPEEVEIGFLGFGKMFVNMAVDVPAFANLPFTVLSVRPDDVRDRPDLVRAIARTIGRGNDLIHDDFPRAVAALQKAFARGNPQAIEIAMKRDKDMFPRGARMSEAMWKNGIAVMAAAGAIKKAPAPTEGLLWTNRFVA